MTFDKKKNMIFQNSIWAEIKKLRYFQMYADFYDIDNNYDMAVPNRRSVLMCKIQICLNVQNTKHNQLLLGTKDDELRSFLNVSKSLAHQPQVSSYLK